MNTLSGEVRPQTIDLSKFAHITRLKPRPMTMDELERKQVQRQGTIVAIKKLVSSSKEQPDKHAIKKRETGIERAVREMKEEEQRNSYKRPIENK